MTSLLGIHSATRPQRWHFPVGTLDAGTDFAEAIRYHLYRVKSYAPTARVCMILPLNTTAVPAAPAGTLQQYRDIIEAVAVGMNLQGQNVEVWKPHEALGLLDPTNAAYFADGVHPTALGHAILGEWVARKILGA
jgi:lysophospholipase L1-like esterase